MTSVPPPTEQPNTDAATVAQRRDDVRARIEDVHQRLVRVENEKYWLTLKHDILKGELAQLLFEQEAIRRQEDEGA